MKITDKKDETLYKNFYFKSLSKFGPLNRKKANLNLVQLIFFQVPSS